MIGLLVPALASVAVALALGGSLSAWSRIRVHWWPLALAGLLVQLVVYSPPFDALPAVVAAGPFLNVGTMLTALAVLVRNGLAAPTHLRSAWLAAGLGVLLNVVVMAVNGGYMPRVASEGGQLAIPSGATPVLRNVAPMTADTRLWFLADVVRQPDWWPASNIVSVGDLVLWSGITWWAFLTTFAGRRLRATG